MKSSEKLQQAKQKDYAKLKEKMQMEMEEKYRGDADENLRAACCETAKEEVGNILNKE